MSAKKLPNFMDLNDKTLALLQTGMSHERYDLTSKGD